MDKKGPGKPTKPAGRVSHTGTMGRGGGSSPPSRGTMGTGKSGCTVKGAMGKQSTGKGY